MVAALAEDELCVFAKGMASHRRLGYVTRLPGLVYLPALDVDNEGLLARRRTLARTAALREELMAAAWHPSRMRRWCLEYDDEFFETDASLNVQNKSARSQQSLKETCCVQ